MFGSAAVQMFTPFRGHAATGCAPWAASVMFVAVREGYFATCAAVEHHDCLFFRCRSAVPSTYLHLFQVLLERQNYSKPLKSL